MLRGQFGPNLRPLPSREGESARRPGATNGPPGSLDCGLRRHDGAAGERPGVRASVPMVPPLRRGDGRDESRPYGLVRDYPSQPGD